MGVGIKTMGLDLFVQLHQFCMDGINVATERCGMFVGD